MHLANTPKWARNAWQCCWRSSLGWGANKMHGKARLLQPGATNLCFESREAPLYRRHWPVILERPVSRNLRKTAVS